MREKHGEQYTYAQTHFVENVRELIDADELDVPVAIAGRLLGRRNQGNLVFGDVDDLTGKIQIIADTEMTPELDELANLNIGDWVGITGQTGKSKRGEPSIYVSDWRRLAATELPFPDKHSGLTDTDTIYRQRYLDLATNRESMNRFRQRSKIVSFIRRSLEEQDFIEVETPMLQSIYGGAAAKPFETHHNALDQEMYLRIAPELYLKRLVVGGLQRVFEIGRVFRNEGMSTRHNPEFTMIEVYAALWDYEKQMELTENLVAALSMELHGTTTIEYQGREVDLSAPWERKTMDELVSAEVGEDVSIDSGVDHLRALCDLHDVPYETGYGPGKLLLELYEKLCEGNLWGPIFVTDYPVEVSPLARDHRSRPGYTERFEGIVAGREMCNGYTELNDPKIQYERFLSEEDASEYDDEAMKMDFDYIRALKYGLPPTAGLGIGIDRLAMLLTNAASIRDVVLFPTMRPDGYRTSYDLNT